MSAVIISSLFVTCGVKAFRNCGHGLGPDAARLHPNTQYRMAVSAPLNLQAKYEPNMGMDR